VECLCWRGKKIVEHAFKDLWSTTSFDKRHDVEGTDLYYVRNPEHATLCQGRHEKCAELLRKEEGGEFDSQSHGLSPWHHSHLNNLLYSSLLSQAAVKASGPGYILLATRVCGYTTLSYHGRKPVFERLRARPSQRSHGPDELLRTPRHRETCY
jgi:hypothetical protein